MNSIVKLWVMIGATFCALSIILGAFAAHALKGTLGDYGKLIFDKALFYHSIHALSILIISIFQIQYSELNFNLAIYSFVIGIILFSGSLYILAVSDMKWLGAITPIGGIAFIIGWIVVFYQFYRYN